MSEWKEVRLGDVLNLRRGYDLPHSEMREGNIPVAGSNGIIGTHNVATPIEPCITVGRSGSAGSTFIYDKAWAHNTTLYIDDFKGNDPKYLYYLLLSLPLKKMAGGSAVPSLNRNHIHPLSIFFPTTLKTQRSIASILSSLDDKIAVNRRICENLEAQAQALFKHWFIDFAPFLDKPSGKAERKNGKFVESELGMIPEGWRVGTLGDIADLIKPSVKPIENVDYSHYSIPAFDNNQIPSIDNGGTIKSNKFAIYDSVTLLSKLNPVHKRIWFVSKAGDNAICSTEFLPFYAKDREHSPFIYCYLNSWRNYREIANGAKGTTNSHQRIDANAILSRRLAYDEDAISMFCNLVADLLKLKNKAAQESIRLATLRDTLLPKLMSGQIKVNEIEKRL